MHPRVISVALVGLLVAALIVTYLAAGSPAEPATTLLYPKETPDSMLWPTNRSWVWSINSLDPSVKGDSLSLVARVVHERLAKGESPTVGSRTISKTESEAELPFGKVLGVKPVDSAIVGVQLVDLGAVGLLDGKGSLRVLLQLRVGGAAVSRNGQQSLIEGDNFVGQAANSERQWKGGELHLQTLFVQSGDRVAIYDIVLIQSE